MLLFLKFASGVAVLYLVLALLIALVQDRLLFPRWATVAGLPLPPTAKRLFVGAGSGDQLVGVHLPQGEQQRKPRKLVLGFGGNAWNANDLVMHLHEIFPDRDIVAFHYRGYAPGTGKPSAGAILEDALAIHDDVVALLAPDQMVVVGLSVGAGPATRLASVRPLAGLILVTPFDTLEALAREHYQWLPVRFLLRHHMDVAGDLAVVTAPVAVISASQDTIVPPRRTEPVRQSAQTLVVDRVIANAGHNDIYSRAGYKRAMQDAMALFEAGGRTR